MVGFKNGDRSYKLEVSPGTNIGTYHAMDVQKVTLRYMGQQQTCARCHETAKNCRGGAMARKCEAANGPKVEFSDYILKLWNDIGYLPGDVEMASIYDDHGDSSEQTGGTFTPIKPLTNAEKYSGVSIQQFPKETDSGEIMELLVNSGLPEANKESVLIRPNGLVSINNIENKTCLDLITNIHSKKFFGRKLFCNGVIPLTPEKPEEPLSASTVPTTSSNELKSSPPTVPSLTVSTSVSVAAAMSTQPDITFISQSLAAPIMSQAEMLNEDSHLKLSDTLLV